MGSVRANRSKIKKSAAERSKRFGGDEVVKAEFTNHDNQMMRKDQPRPQPDREMAAASSGGFRGVRKRSDGTTDYGDDREGDQDGGGEITVSVADGAIVLEIQYLDDLVVVGLDPSSAVNLVASLSLALSEAQGGDE